MSIGSAASDPPDARNKDNATPKVDQTPVAGANASESTVACPCADDFNAAIKIYDARPGTAIQSEYDGCADPKGGLGKYGISMHKFDALTPSEKGRYTNMNMDASRNRTLWGTRYVHCWVSVWTDSQPISWLFKPPRRNGLSDAELAACVRMLREIAHCQ